MTIDAITSYRANQCGCQAVTYFTLVLIIGFSASISLYSSTARNNPDFLALLCYPYKLMLGVCFALMLLGLQALFSLNWVLVDVIYPIYNGNTPVADWFDPASKTLNEAVDVRNFTWVTQRVVNVAVDKLNVCLVALPVTITVCTYIFYALWRHWSGRTHLQTVVDFMDDIPAKLARLMLSRVFFARKEETRAETLAIHGFDG
jgi:hypothetical protein